MLVSAVSTLMVWAAIGMKTIYENYDGVFYVVVAKTWYVPDLIRGLFSFPLPLEYYPAHFPLYPLAIKLLTFSGINYLQAMVGVNLIVTSVTVLIIFQIFSKMKWGNPFWISMAWLFWWPRMWAVRSVGSPETLFVLFIVLSLYCFNLKKYWLAGIAGSLAVLTKSPGLLLLVAYGVWFIVNYIKTKKWEIRIWPVGLIGLTLLGLFYFFQTQTGNFWAYFKSGDNIHLGISPFGIFDSSQPWVGSFWLEDVIWIYLLGGLGVYRTLKKDLTWGIFGVVYFITILFVAHRDIARYSLPLVPIVLLGFGEIWERKEVKWAFCLMLIPIFFYTLNFVTHNTLNIGDWANLL